MTDSALSPREIQARVRAGASVAEVADAAGVSEEHVEPFAGPVLAERSYVVGTALECPVRRRGEPSSTRDLKQIITDRLKGHHVAFDDVDLDAWRDDDRRWHISARYTVAGEDRVAELLFDPRARFSISGNDEGRWLVGEHPAQGASSRDPDAEPTVDLNDEWAIVRAVQDGDPDGEASTVLEPPTVGWPVNSPEQPEPLDSDDELSAPIPLRRSARRSASADPPDYAPAQLEAVDGVYDIVPHESEMDVLYEMLAGFNEDSVKIYAGLTQPITDQEGPTDFVEADAGSPEADQAIDEAQVNSASVDVVVVEEVTYQEYEVTLEATEPTRRIRRPAAKAADAKPSTKTSNSTSSRSKATSAKTKNATTQDQGAEDAATPGGAQQGTSDADDAGTETEPAKTRRSRKKGRAQVPSWDEIMSADRPPRHLRTEPSQSVATGRCGSLIQSDQEPG